MMSTSSSTLAASLPPGIEALVRYAMAGGLLLALMPVAGAILPDPPAALDLAAHFLVPSLLLSLSMVVLGILTRRLRVAVVAGCLLALALAVLFPYAGTRIGPSPGPLPALQPDLHAFPLTAYFHNTWAGNRRIDEAVDAASASGADVLVLAETGQWRWPAFRRLLANHPNAISCDGRDECDLTLYSRLPIADPVAFHDRLSGARGVAATVLGPEGGEVRVVGIHLARPIPPDGRPAQLRQMEALFRSDLFRPHLPTVLLGDFNAVPWSHVMRTFAERLQLRRIGGIEGSWPNFLPTPLRIRIDQALVSPSVKVVGQHLGQGWGSDHRPLTIGLDRP